MEKRVALVGEHDVAACIFHVDKPVADAGRRDVVTAPVPVDPDLEREGERAEIGRFLGCDAKVRNARSWCARLA